MHGVYVILNPRKRGAVGWATGRGTEGEEPRIPPQRRTKALKVVKVVIRGKTNVVLLIRYKQTGPV